MKTLKFICCLSLIILFTACKEKEPIDNDFRDCYVGDYLCQKTEHIYDMDSIYPNVISVETVSITKVNDSLIRILDAQVKFDSKTKIFGSGWYPDPKSDYKVLSGHFSGDSIYFQTIKGGLGAGVNCNYKGIKQ